MASSLVRTVNIILLALTIPLQPSTVTNLSVKPDDVHRTRYFIRKIIGAQPKPSIIFRRWRKRSQFLLSSTNYYGKYSDNYFQGYIP